LGTPGFDAVENGLSTSLPRPAQLRESPWAARPSRSEPVLPRSASVIALTVALSERTLRPRSTWPHRQPRWQRDTCCGSEPCERRVTRDRRETARAGPSPAQVTDLRNQFPGAAVSRAVERFAEQYVSRW